MPRLYSLNEDLTTKLRKVPFSLGVAGAAVGDDITYFSDAGYGIDTNKHAPDVFDTLTRAQLEAIALQLGTDAETLAEMTKQEIVRQMEGVVHGLAVDDGLFNALVLSSGDGTRKTGTLEITVTSAALAGGSKAVSVVLDGSETTTSLLAAAIRAALAADEDIAALFAVTGADANIILTRLEKVANDDTLAVALTDDDGTNATLGASGDTGGGVATALQQETMTLTAGAAIGGTLKITVTSGLLAGGFKIIDAPVLATDSTASLVAAAIRAALAADEDIAEHYTVGGADANVVLTAIESAENDATLAMAISYAGATGVTIGASGNTEAGVAPAAQIETLQVTAGATYTGKMLATLTGGLLTGGNKAVSVDVAAGDDASDVAGKIAAALAADTDVAEHYTCEAVTDTVKVTAKAAAANDETLALALTSAGATGVTVGASGDTAAGAAAVQQITTTTITGAANSQGLSSWTFPAAVFPAGFESFGVALEGTEDASGVAAKVRAALEADADISAEFNIGGTGANVVATAKVAAANDETMGIILMDAGGTGITATADNGETQGVAGTLQIETIAVSHKADAAGVLTFNVTDSVIDEDVEIAVLADDTTSDVAGKIRAALGLVAAITDRYTIGGADANIVLTRKVAEANDNALEMSLASGGDSGVTVGTSTNDTGGNAGTAQVETAAVETAAVNGGGTLLIEISSALLDGGVKEIECAVTAEDDTVSEVAAKIRAALGADADIAEHFAISGDAANIVLTAKVKAADDETLEIALAGDGATGVTANASDDTTTGVPGVSQIETVAVTAVADVENIAIAVDSGGQGGDYKLLITDNANYLLTGAFYMDDAGAWSDFESGDSIAGEYEDSYAVVAEINESGRIVGAGIVQAAFTA